MKNEFAETFPDAGPLLTAMLHAFMFVWRRGDPEPDSTDPNYLHQPLLFKNALGEAIASRPFEIAINSAIALNVLCMMMVSDNMSEGFEHLLETIEMAFSFVFLMEMLLNGV